MRELQNCIERAVILTEGDTIHARHLSLSFRLSPQAAASEEDLSPWAQVDLSGTLAEATRRAIGEVERRKIEQALKEAVGNRGKAAEVLQVSHKTFMAKLANIPRMEAPGPTRSGSPEPLRSAKARSNRAGGGAPARSKRS